MSRKKPDLNVVEMPSEKDEMEAAVLDIRRQIPGLLKMWEERSRLRHGIFMAHKSAGFSEQQAYGILINEINQGEY